jgi:hypothetical protein
MTADNRNAAAGEQRVIEQRGLYFDELEEGVRYAHRPGRTVTETDNVLFTTLTMTLPGAPGSRSANGWSTPCLRCPPWWGSRFRN